MVWTGFFPFLRLNGSRESANGNLAGESSATHYTLSHDIDIVQEKYPRLMERIDNLNGHYLSRRDSHYRNWRIMQTSTIVLGGLSTFSAGCSAINFTNASLGLAVKISVLLLTASTTTITALMARFRVSERTVQSLTAIEEIWDIKQTLKTGARKVSTKEEWRALEENIRQRLRDVVRMQMRTHYGVAAPRAKTD